jgi:signal transduction histidine kinase
LSGPPLATRERPQSATLAGDWQRRLFARFLWLALGLGTLLLARDIATGLDIAYSGLVVCLSAVGVVVLRYHGRLGRTVPALLLAAGVITLGLTAADGQSASVPSLCFAMLPATMATLAYGPLVGAAIALATLVTMIALELAFPISSLRDAYRFTNEMGMVLFGYFVAWALDRSFRGCQDLVESQQRRLEVINAERVAMAQALFADLGPVIGTLREQLADGQPLDAADPTLEQLVDRLRRARLLGRKPAQGAEGPLDAPGLDEIRLRVALRLLVILCVLTAALLLRNLIWGGPFAGSAAALVVALSMLAALRRPGSRVTPARAGLVVSIGYGLAVLASFVGWGADAESPCLAILPALVLWAVLLNGPVVTVGALLFGFAVLASALLVGAADRDSWYLVMNIATLQLLLGVIALSALRLRRALLLCLEEHNEELAEAIRLRHRLAGTLFHDVSNQLAALQGVLILGAARRTDPTIVLSRARTLCQRIERLVAASRSFLLDERSVDAGRLQALPVAELFADMETLFQARLRAKRQCLRIAAPSELAVLGLPEIVTESVLGNLVANAIKFAPLDSAIELEAVRRGDQVALVVRDSGPGIGAVVLEGLSAGQAVPSTPGSAGERGQGLGLGLVRDHLRRLGGTLTLLPRPEGGTEATVLLPSA